MLTAYDLTWSLKYMRSQQASFTIGTSYRNTIMMNTSERQVLEYIEDYPTMRRTMQVFDLF